MLQRLGLIGVTAAALALALAGCPDGGGVATCTSDTECQSDELCHPNAKVCVRKCSSTTDCPTEAKTCKTTTATGAQMICTCATDQLCEQELGTGTVCSDSWEVCTPTEGTSCSATAVQPDTCGYGQFCGTGSTCQAVAPPTCGNISGPHAATWNAATSTGPIIYEATKVSFAPDPAGGPVFCGSAEPNTRVRVRVKAYRTTGTFPTTDAAFAADLHYVRTDGSEGPSSAITGLTVTNNGRNAEWDQNFCVNSSLSQFTGALHFVGGNEFCFVIQK
jgi:hypothetical protein